MLVVVLDSHFSYIVCIYIFYIHTYIYLRLLLHGAMVLFKCAIAGPTPPPSALVMIMVMKYDTKANIGP